MLTVQMKEAFRLLDDSNRPIFLPVVHVADHKQACHNIAIACANGADGVFLINHGISGHDLIRTAATVQAQFTNLWLGVNRLDRCEEDAFTHLPNFIEGVWTDGSFQHCYLPADRIAAAGYARKNFKGLYFGGVAFKYRQEPLDLSFECRFASGIMDVVTTSGPGTGLAADPTKIKAMRGALGEFPLAIASGVTPDNIGDYLGLVDFFLVATGISKDFHNLDATKVRAVADKIRSWK